MHPCTASQAALSPGPTAAHALMVASSSSVQAASSAQGAVGAHTEPSSVSPAPSFISTTTLRKLLSPQKGQELERMLYFTALAGT